MSLIAQRLKILGFLRRLWRGLLWLLLALLSLLTLLPLLPLLSLLSLLTLLSLLPLLSLLTLLTLRRLRSCSARPQVHAVRTQAYGYTGGKHDPKGFFHDVPTFCPEIPLLRRAYRKEPTKSIIGQELGATQTFPSARLHSPLTCAGGPNPFNTGYLNTATRRFPPARAPVSTR